MPHLASAMEAPHLMVIRLETIKLRSAPEMSAVPSRASWGVKAGDSVEMFLSMKG
jgi:hypothetical protein